MNKKVLTMRYAGVALSIRTVCNICSFRDAVIPSPVRAEGLTAMWDTGANITCISKALAHRLNLKVDGRATVASANGINSVYMHLVDIELPNGLCFNEVKVLSCDLVTEDVLIGMDIISRGDFAYSTAGGATTFSFCTPAIYAVDFMEM
jgi:hypothetical protein